MGILVVAVAWSAGGVAAQEAAGPTVPVATMLEDQPSALDPSARYTLYLPRGFDPGRRHPVLLIFDPRGRATMAAELFRPAADRFGWILVSSNDSRSDGDWAPNRKAIAALWPEAHVLTGADPRRLYATGFSGGAIVAWALAQMTDEVAGVLSVGGRLAAEVPTDRIGFVHWGAAGSWDFNLTEMREIEELLEGRDVPHRLEVFDGPHRWCPAELASEGIAWMELQAMRRTLRPVDPALVATLFEEDVARAEALEAAGDLVAAGRRWAAIVATFEGLRDVDLAARRRDRLQADPAFTKALKAERRADAADERFVAETLPLLAAVGGPQAMTAGRLRRELGLDRLLEQATGEGPEATAAKRMLARVSSLAGFYLANDHLAQGHWRDAETVLEIAVVAEPEAPPHVWYNLACAASRSGHLDRALEALEEAAGRGFSDPAHALADPDLEALRASPEHADRVQALVQRLRLGPPGT